MREYIDLPVLVNLVSMIRGEIEGAILLADHDNDGRFYDSLVHQSARVIPSPAMAIELLSSATLRGIAGLVAAVRNARATNHLADLQFAPYLGDISSILICSSNFERAITKITGRTWYKCSERELKSLACHCVAMTCALEKITTVAGKNSNIEPALEFIDWSAFNLCEKTIIKTTNQQVFDTVKSSFHEDLKKPLRELLLNCDGDIAMKLISTAIQKFQPHGLKSETTVSSTELAKMLELSYDFENFEEDPVFWKMRRWERSNPKYHLLSQWRTLDSFQLVWDQRYWESDLKSLLNLGKSDSGLSLIKLDLDNFKMVNTTLGHNGGDEAIKLASKVILSTASGLGEVYRRGGDEFVIIAPDLREKNAEKLAEQIRLNIQTAFYEWGTIKGLDNFPTASIGLVDADYGVCCDELIRIVDQAQQLAKDKGKNTVISEILKRLEPVTTTTD